MGSAGYRLLVANDSETYLALRPPVRGMIRRGAVMMNLKQGLDASIESTMAFANNVKHQPVPDLSAVMGQPSKRLPTHRNRSRPSPLRQWSGQRQSGTKSDSE